ncbi:hypothetical protein [Salinibaculum rarum]|uniref:hypothetical protein n=1 Tax=Salinibaculum rarum TaxID=3058903 RepID=UPI00265E45C2|nr:hypothetical protein [Salinibaculum sp. KK48]
MSSEINQHAFDELADTEVRPTFRFQPGVPFGLGGLADDFTQRLEDVELGHFESPYSDVAVAVYMFKSEYNLPMSDMARTRAQSIVHESRSEAGRNLDSDVYCTLLAYAVVHSFSKEYVIQRGMTRELTDTLRAGTGMLVRDIIPAIGKNVSDAARGAVNRVRDTVSMMTGFGSRAKQASDKVRRALERGRLDTPERDETVVYPAENAMGGPDADETPYGDSEDDEVYAAVGRE